MQVDDVRHPAFQNAGAPDGGAAADVAPAPSTAVQTRTPAADQGADDQAPPPDKGGALTKIEDTAKKLWTDHKLLIILVGTGVVVMNSPKLQKKLHMR